MSKHGLAPILLLLLLLLLDQSRHSVHSFQTLLPLVRYRTQNSSKRTTLSAVQPLTQQKTPTATNPRPTIGSIKSQIESAILPTERGIKASPTEKSKAKLLIAQLESVSPTREPARDPRTGGTWVVDYSDAPPPSNGQLGPFLGMARQVIDLEGGTYSNVLTVGPNGWLEAELRAFWMEWDGVPLGEEIGNDDDKEVGDDGELDPPSSPFSMDFLKVLFPQPERKVDYGATSWKVDFEYLSLRLFGVELFKQKFKDTSRIWKTTYLDDDCRVVRAGKTGLDYDDYVFYMTKE